MTADDTKTRIVEATIETIRAEGITGTSARAIARTGGFNQALIFYHFGTIEDTLIAAMHHLSLSRIEQYRDRLEGVTSLQELAAIARDLHQGDRDSGNLTTLTQLMAGALGNDELSKRLRDTFEPWMVFVRDMVSRIVADTPFNELVDVEDVAFGISAMFIGIELLSDLDPERASDSLFDTMEMMAGAVELLLGAGSQASSSESAERRSIPVE